MEYRIEVLASFKKEAKRLRISSKGRGKSGGARVISFTVVVAIDETEINLLYIYDKAERESISFKEIEELLRKNGLK